MPRRRRFSYDEHFQDSLTDLQDVLESLGITCQPAANGKAWRRVQSGISPPEPGRLFEAEPFTSEGPLTEDQLHAWTERNRYAISGAAWKLPEAEFEFDLSEVRLWQTLWTLCVEGSIQCECSGIHILEMKWSPEPDVWFAAKDGTLLYRNHDRFDLVIFRKGQRMSIPRHSTGFRQVFYNRYVKKGGRWRRRRMAP